MGLEGYGVAKGCAANMVLLQARDAIEAVRLRPARLAVIRAGRVISRQPAAVSALSLEGRPKLVNPADYAPKI